MGYSHTSIKFKHGCYRKRATIKAEKLLQRTPIDGVNKLEKKKKKLNADSAKIFRILTSKTSLAG